MRATAVAVALAVVLAAPASGRPCEPVACVCSRVELGMSPADGVNAQRDRAERVVLGSVVRIDTLARAPWGSGENAVSLRPIVARVRVERVWRGPLVDTMTVMLTTTVGRSSCDLQLRPTASYLIFATRTASGPLAARQCSGTAEKSTATAAIAALGVGEAPASSSRNQR